MPWCRLDQRRQQPGATYLLAEDTIANYRKELGYAEVAERSGGNHPTWFRALILAASSTQRVFDYYADRDTWGMDNAWQILVAEYVATGEGTGNCPPSSRLRRGRPNHLRGGGNPGGYLGG
jgi:hypothetical protein